MSQRESLITSHIEVHTVYYKPRALLPINKLKIYDKDKRKQVKVIILYKSAIELNTFLFEPAEPKTGHSKFYQDQVTFNYILYVCN